MRNSYQVINDPQYGLNAQEKMTLVMYVSTIQSIKAASRNSSESFLFMQLQALNVSKAQFSLQGDRAQVLKDAVYQIENTEDFYHENYLEPAIRESMEAGFGQGFNLAGLIELPKFETDTNIQIEAFKRARIIADRFLYLKSAATKSEDLDAVARLQKLLLDKHVQYLLNPPENNPLVKFIEGNTDFTLNPDIFKVEQAEKLVVEKPVKVKSPVPEPSVKLSTNTTERLDRLNKEAELKRSEKKGSPENSSEEPKPVAVKQLPVVEAITKVVESFVRKDYQIAIDHIGYLINDLKALEAGVLFNRNPSPFDILTEEAKTSLSLKEKFDVLQILYLLNVTPDAKTLLPKKLKLEQKYIPQAKKQAEKDLLEDAEKHAMRTVKTFSTDVPNLLKQVSLLHTKFTSSKQDDIGQDVFTFAMLLLDFQEAFVYVTNPNKAKRQDVYIDPTGKIGLEFNAILDTCQAFLNQTQSMAQLRSILSDSQLPVAIGKKLQKIPYDVDPAQANNEAVSKLEQNENTKFLILSEQKTASESQASTGRRAQAKPLVKPKSETQTSSVKPQYDQQSAAYLEAYQNLLKLVKAVSVSPKSDEAGVQLAHFTKLAQLVQAYDAIMKMPKGGTIESAEEQKISEALSDVKTKLIEPAFKAEAKKAMEAISIVQLVSYSYTKEGESKALLLKNQKLHLGQIAVFMVSHSAKFESLELFFDATRATADRCIFLNAVANSENFAELLDQENANSNRGQKPTYRQSLVEFQRTLTIAGKDLLLNPPSSSFLSSNPYKDKYAPHANVLFIDTETAKKGILASHPPSQSSTPSKRTQGNQGDVGKLIEEAVTPFTIGNASAAQVVRSVEILAYLSTLPSLPKKVNVNGPLQELKVVMKSLADHIIGNFATFYSKEKTHSLPKVIYTIAEVKAPKEATENEDAYPQYFGVSSVPLVNSSTSPQQPFVASNMSFSSSGTPIPSKSELPQLKKEHTTFKVVEKLAELKANLTASNAAVLADGLITLYGNISNGLKFFAEQKSSSQYKELDHNLFLIEAFFTQETVSKDPTFKTLKLPQYLNSSKQPAPDLANQFLKQNASQLIVVGAPVSKIQSSGQSTPKSKSSTQSALVVPEDQKPANVIVKLEELKNNLGNASEAKRLAEEIIKNLYGKMVYEKNAGEYTKTINLSMSLVEVFFAQKEVSKNPAFKGLTLPEVGVPTVKDPEAGRAFLQEEAPQLIVKVAPVSKSNVSSPSPKSSLSKSTPTPQSKPEIPVVPDNYKPTKVVEKLQKLKDNLNTTDATQLASEVIALHGEIVGKYAGGLGDYTEQLNLSLSLIEVFFAQEAVSDNTAFETLALPQVDSDGLKNKPEAQLAYLQRYAKELIVDAAVIAKNPTGSSQSTPQKDKKEKVDSSKGVSTPQSNASTGGGMFDPSSGTDLANTSGTAPIKQATLPEEITLLTPSTLTPVPVQQTEAQKKDVSTTPEKPVETKTGDDDAKNKQSASPTGSRSRAGSGSAATNPSALMPSPKKQKKGSDSAGDELSDGSVTPPNLTIDDEDADTAKTNAQNQ